MSNTSRVIAKTDPTAQRLQPSRQVESREHHASASAKAGLNLNIFGVFSGALSSKSKKTTYSNPDGSSRSVEERNEAAQGCGQAALSGAAYAQAEAQERKRAQRQVERVDHLGIEG